MKWKKVYSNKICTSTNSSCNLNCIYCYEKNKNNLEFDVDEAFNVIDEQLQTKTQFGTKIKLHGGEPFMVFSKIKQLCERLWANQYIEYYHFHLTTNGTLVHGPIQEWLYKNRDKITIKLSLDGDKKSSDINRPYSFDKIDIPFFVKTWPDLRVNMTITPATLPYLFENIKFLHSVNINNIISHFALMVDWKKYELEEVLYEQMQELANYYLDNPEITPCHFFRPNIEDTLYKPLFNAACVRGQGEAYDYQTKKYYPCFMCFPALAGKEASDELSKIDFTDTEKLEEECCINCPFINICPTCYAENYITRGKISHRDMDLCSYQKIIIAILFKYEYARLMKTDNPSSEDINKMMAIQKWYDEIEAILNNIGMIDN